MLVLNKRLRMSKDNIHRFQNKKCLEVKRDCDEIKLFLDTKRMDISNVEKSKHYLIIGYNYHDVYEPELAQECFNKISEEYVADKLVEDIIYAYDKEFIRLERQMNGLPENDPAKEHEFLEVAFGSIPLMVEYNVKGYDIFISKLSNTKLPINIPRVLTVIGGNNEDQES